MLDFFTLNIQFFYCLGIEKKWELSLRVVLLIVRVDCVRLVPENS